MKKYINISGYKVLLLIGFLTLAIAPFVPTAQANPSFFPPHSACSTSAATSTVSTLATSSPTATTTCDLFNSATSLNTPIAADSAFLAIQYRAPQATTILTGTIQYSDDNVDWYGDNIVSLATTSAVADITAARIFTFTAGITSTSSRMIGVQTPTRYMRVVFSVPAGSATSTVWATIIPKKQVK